MGVTDGDGVMLPVGDGVTVLAPLGDATTLLDGSCVPATDANGDPDTITDAVGRADATCAATVSVAAPDAVRRSGVRDATRLLDARCVPAIDKSGDVEEPNDRDGDEVRRADAIWEGGGGA